jgi:hypothetical protein
MATVQNQIELLLMQMGVDHVQDVNTEPLERLIRDNERIEQFLTPTEVEPLGAFSQTYPTINAWVRAARDYLRYDQNERCLSWENAFNHVLSELFARDREVAQLKARLARAQRAAGSEEWSD